MQRRADDDAAAAGVLLKWIEWNNGVIGNMHTVMSLKV